MVVPRQPTAFACVFVTDLYCFILLAERPFIGRPRPEFDPDLRSHVVVNTRYITFYYPRGYGVEIVSVFHGSQRLMSLLDE